MARTRKSAKHGVQKRSPRPLYPQLRQITSGQELEIDSKPVFDAPDDSTNSGSDSERQLADHDDEAKAEALRISNCDPKGYYKILGVDEKASNSKIETSYRRKARLIHPDINKDRVTTDAFQKLGNARENLLDEEKRLKYDRETLPALKKAKKNSRHKNLQSFVGSDIEDIGDVGEKFERSAFDGTDSGASDSDEELSSVDTFVRDIYGDLTPHVQDLWRIYVQRGIGSTAHEDAKSAIHDGNLKIESHNIEKYGVQNKTFGNIPLSFFEGQGKLLTQTLGRETSPRRKQAAKEILTRIRKIIKSQEFPASWEPPQLEELESAVLDDALNYRIIAHRSGRVTGRDDSTGSKVTVSRAPLDFIIRTNNPAHPIEVYLPSELPADVRTAYLNSSEARNIVGIDKKIDRFHEDTIQVIGITGHPNGWNLFKAVLILRNGVEEVINGTAMRNLIGRADAEAQIRKWIIGGKSPRRSLESHFQARSLQPPMTEFMPSKKVAIAAGPVAENRTGNTYLARIDHQVAQLQAQLAELMSSRQEIANPDAMQGVEEEL